MLSRLAEKKVVRETKKNNIGIYEPILSRQKARRIALKSLANQAFDGALGPLMHFLLENQKLSSKQKQEVLQALEPNQSRKKGGRK